MQLETPELQASQTSDGFVAIALLLRHKYYILVMTCIAAVASILLVLSLPNYFTAEISAVPPRKTSSALDAAAGSVSSTLREFGLSKLAGKHGDGYDLIVLLQSRQIKDSVIKNFSLRDVYQLKDSSLFATREELESNLTVNVMPEGNYVVTVDDPDPKRAADIANYMVAMTNQLSQQLDRRETEVLYKQFQDRIASTDKEIEDTREVLSKYAKTNMIFSPVDQVKSAAMALAEMKANIMKQEIVLSYMEESFGKDDPLTKRERAVLEELRTKVNSSESESGFIGNFSLADAPRAAIPYLHYYSQLEALIKIKAFLVPSFEQVKLDLTKIAPSLYVLDEAIPPFKKSRPKRSLIVLSVTAGVFFLTSVFVLLLHQLGRFRQRYKNTVVG